MPDYGFSYKCKICASDCYCCNPEHGHNKAKLCFVHYCQKVLGVNLND